MNADQDSELQRLRTVAQHAPDYLLGLDRRGTIVYMNRPPPGVALSDMLGRSIEGFMEPAARADLRAALARAFETGQVTSCRSRSLDLLRHYVARISPIVGDERIDQVVVIAHDVTELVAAEAAWRESEGRFRALVAAAFEGLLVSVDGRIVEANDAVAQMTGYAREALAGMTVAQLTTPESARAVMERIRAGSEEPYEAVAVRRDGSTFPCELLGRNMLYRGQAARITGVRDLSERKRIEERTLASEKLEQLGVLAGGLAHDFNNLLLVMLGHAQLGLSELSPGDPMRKHFEQVQTAATRASELTRQLLTCAGRTFATMDAVDLGPIVTDTSELLRVSVSQRAAIVLGLAPGLPQVNADAGQLRQVVMNLITNASDALGDKPGTIAVRTSERRVDREDLCGAALDATEGPGRYVQLEVRDDGCGIDAATRSRIFDPFFTTKPTGRGLGLASVLGIVRAHKGAIVVSSEPARGTSIKVLLPCAPVAP